ncbi:MAG: ABC transporter ATP-binding protein [Alphaproteobacteria bacterium]
MLYLTAIETFYQQSQALFDVSFSLEKGEVVSLLGRNGMGKTTTIRSILGLTPPRNGQITFKGRKIQGLSSFQIARQGIGFVPEGRQIFPRLTVKENLLVVAVHRQSAERSWNLQRVFSLFPRLQERRDQPASSLSGGEQQMLAIGRALMTNPCLLILDEATEGLAPLIRQEIWDCLSMLKREALTILIVDKDLVALQKLVDRHVIIEKGRTVWQGSNKVFSADLGLARRYLGV